MSSTTLPKRASESNVRHLDQTSASHPLSIDSRYYGTHFESTFGVSWLYLKPSSPKRFTPGLIEDLRNFQRQTEDVIKKELLLQNQSSIKYQVFSSRIPNTFSLGGDLEFFKEKIRQGDRNSLTEYARNCIDLVYTNVTHFKLPITTISLVQGSALGGGFEAALANDIVISERQCKFGLPEILFNMFPGMGAYQLLCRRIPEIKAEKIILSGKTYSAEELHDMGLVDVIAEEGEGENAVWSYIRDNHDKSSGRLALHKAIESVNALNYGDFVKIVDIWVETALGLGKKDLDTMDFLVRAQQRLD